MVKETDLKSVVKFARRFKSCSCRVKRYIIVSYSNKIIKINFLSGVFQVYYLLYVEYTETLNKDTSVTARVAQLVRASVL